MIKYIQKLMDKLKKSEKGQGMVEYALIIAFVAAIAIYVLNGGMRTAVNQAFTNASNMVTSATTQANLESATTTGNGGGNGGGNG